MQELKYNSVNTVAVGPIVSVSDGTTPVETLDLSTADVAELFVDNSAAAHSIAGNSVTTVATAPGHYWIDLTASNCSVLGKATVAVGDDSLIAPYAKDYMVLSEYQYDVRYGNGGVNSGALAGVPWYGSLDSINVSVCSLPSGHGLSEGRVMIALRGGSDATAKARIGTLSGNTITVDPTWTSDSETLPGGTVTAYVTPMPKSTTASLPNVNATQVSGTVQTAGDIYDRLSEVSAVCDSVLEDTGTTLETRQSTMSTNLTAVMSTGTTTDAKVDIIDTNVDAIVVDTGTTLENRQSTMSTNLGVVLGQTSTTGVVIADADYSAVSIGGVARVNSSVTIANAVYSGVSMRLDSVVHSGATVAGINDYANISDVTLAAGGGNSLLSTDLGDSRLVQEALFALRNRVSLGESKATVFLTDDTTASYEVNVTRSSLSNIGDFNPTS